VNEIRASLLAQRDEAIRLLRAGADAAGSVEPAAAREPVRWILLAAAERCALRPHILGQPVEHALALARALTGERGRD
jgi:hypothetical protein